MSIKKSKKIFYNLNHNCQPKRFLDFLKWKLTTPNPKWPKKVLLNRTDCPPSKVPIGNKIRVSFVGHVSFLIQTNDFNILTDPVWSKRASPFSFIGPKRVIEPGIALKVLPKIDIILISHNHYDHMDLATIKYLWHKDQPIIITPLENQHLLAKHISNIKVITLNWDEHIKINENLSIFLEPSQHWSARGLFDINRCLWGNFIIQILHGAICFIGDSGYNKDLYMNIGKKFDINLSLIPIGAFAPRWFMKDVHMDPAEAVLVHQHLRSKFSIASHFQTFPLASDYYSQAAEELTIALQKNQIPPAEFITPTPGEAYWFDFN